MKYIHNKANNMIFNDLQYIPSHPCLSPHGEAEEILTKLRLMSRSRKQILRITLYSPAFEHVVIAEFKVLLDGEILKEEWSYETIEFWNNSHSTKLGTIKMTDN